MVQKPNKRNNNEKTLIINAIKTDNGYYIQGENNSYIQTYYFNGEKPEKTFHNKWYKIKDYPQKVEISQKQPKINYRYELKDKSLTGIFPASIEREKFCDQGDYEWKVKEEYKDKISLYELKYDEQEDKLEEVDFKFNIILEIDNIKEYAGISYEVNKTKWISDGKINITNSFIEHQLIDKIIFPDIILPSKPSRLSSYDSYRIVREYIKKNIDTTIAVISSDYDFCFAVKKRILKYYEEIYDKENIIRKKNIKNIKVNNEKLIDIFEMTYSPEKYKGYTPIEGFVGKNYDDLKKNIDEYLENIMEEINKPIYWCPKCDGLGVLNIKKIKINPEKEIKRFNIMDI